MMDSVPVVFITGQVRTELLGTDGFQEADTIGITMPIVKHSFMIQHPLEIPRSIHEAFHIARTGRPGPVVVDIPQDLSRADIPYEPVDDVHLPGYQPTTDGNQKQIRLAAKALANARRPVIYAGGGVVTANAAAELIELATSDRFPVTCTVMGLGGFPAPHEQWLGMLGMHGTRTANYAMDEADLIVAIGARFDDRITGKLSEFAPRAKFIHIDIDPAEISKNVAGAHPDRRRRQEHPAAADRRVPRAGARPGPAGGVVVADPRLAGAPSARATRTPTDSEIKPQYMIQALYEATGGDAIVTSDVGQHQMWAAQYFHFAGPRRWINSGGLGTMGFGLPAAMGAKVGCPDETVVCIAGDGSVQMNMQELATCAQEGIAIKVFIMNNGYLGMVRQWQELFWDKRYSQVDMGQWPDFVKLAEAYGATGMRLEDKRTLVDDMQEALATEGPVLVDVRVTREENTYPMIPAGPAGPEHGGVRRWVNQEPRKSCRSTSSRPPSGLRTGRKHILSILVENKPGVLTRIAGPVRAPRLQHRHARGRPDRRRGAVADHADARRRGAPDRPGHQAAAQARQRAQDPRSRARGDAGARAGAVQGLGRRRGRAEVMQICEIFRAKIVDVTKRSVVVEVTGTCDKVDAFEPLVRPFGLIEMARTGEIAIARGRARDVGSSRRGPTGSRPSERA